MRLVAVAVYQDDVSRADNGLHRDLVRGRSTIRSEEEFLATKGPRCLVLSALNIASWFKQRIQAAGGGGRFRHENVGPVEVTEVADPMGIEDRLAARDRKSVERA